MVLFLAANRMAFLPGLGNGTFGPQALTLTGQAPTAVDLGDLDGDGLTDAVVVNRSVLSTNATIHYGVPGAAGPFSAVADVTIPTGVLPVSLAIADINKDGLLDLVIAIRENMAVASNIEVRLGQCM